MENPLVSAIIPFYSNVTWLKEAIESVLNQTYHNIELILVDDGSQEDLSDFLNKYGEKLTYVKKENGGPASARNLGIKRAQGKYIAFLDSDDIWESQKIDKQICLMEKNKAIWSQHSYKIFGENCHEKIIDTSYCCGNVKPLIHISFKVQTSCVMVLRDILIRENIFFEESKRFGEDEMFYELLSIRFRLFYLQGAYSRFRIRGENAGFQSNIQLQHKASIWKDNKNFIINSGISPIGKVAFIFSNYGTVIYNRIRMVFNINKEFEIIAKVLYLLPWILFKIEKQIILKKLRIAG